MTVFAWIGIGFFLVFIGIFIGLFTAAIISAGKFDDLHFENIKLSRQIDHWKCKHEKLKQELQEYVQGMEHGQA